MKLSKKILSLTLAALALPSSLLAVDLTAEIEQTAQIANVSSNKRVLYHVTVRNLAEDNYQGPVRFISFLVPAQASQTGESSLKAVMLPPVTMNLNLQGRSSNRFKVQMDLPYTPKSAYLLGGFINSKKTVREVAAIPGVDADAAFNNNVTPNMVPVGVVENIENNPWNVANDLYSDTDNMSALDGSTAHRWRLFKRGSVDTNGLRALFLVANISNKKLYHASYEKGVVWRNMGQAYDQKGDLLPYDVYHQAPRFEHVPEGNHHLMTLINYNEAVSEPLSNNIDLAPFKASKITVTPSQVWKVVQNDEPVVLNESFFIQTQYAAPVTWSLNASSLPSTISLSQTSGSLVRTQAISLTGSADLSSSQAEWKLELDAADRKTEIPVRIFKITDQSPVLEFASPHVAEAISPFSPEVQHIRLRNTGHSTLLWRLKNASSWIRLVGSSSGEVAAGDEFDLAVFLDGRTRPIGPNIGEIVLQTNSAGGEMRIEVRLDVRAPN